LSQLVLKQISYKI